MMLLLAEWAASLSVMLRLPDTPVVDLMPILWSAPWTLATARWASEKLSTPLAALAEIAKTFTQQLLKADVSSTLRSTAKEKVWECRCKMGPCFNPARTEGIHPKPVVSVGQGQM
mmetsp:Transcript_112309/g.194739  ORF Transcript_112309/g.194739 Transcript_112309/m.194739 type:complete len:115 (+) Transcript_112309:711-1055(+)